jgi:hypothetical protein
MTLVLYPPVIPTIFVSRTLEDLESGKYLLELNPPDRDLVSSPGGQSANQERFPKRIIIAAGQLHQLEVELGMPIATMKKGPEDSGLTPGGHYLKLELVLDTLDAGTIHFVSQPVGFTVSNRPKVATCGPPAAEFRKFGARPKVP